MQCIAVTGQDRTGEQDRTGQLHITTICPVQKFTQKVEANHPSIDCIICNAGKSVNIIHGSISYHHCIT